jgi:hypothetical protein
MSPRAWPDLFSKSDVIVNWSRISGGEFGPCRGGLSMKLSDETALDYSALAPGC